MRMHVLAFHACAIALLHAQVAFLQPQVLQINQYVNVVITTSSLLLTYCSHLRACNPAADTIQLVERMS